MDEGIERLKERGRKDKDRKRERAKARLRVCRYGVKGYRGNILVERGRRWMGRDMHKIYKMTDVFAWNSHWKNLFKVCFSVRIESRTRLLDGTAACR